MYRVPPMGEPQYMVLLLHCRAGKKPRGPAGLACSPVGPRARVAGVSAATLGCSVLGLRGSMVLRVLLPLPSLNPSWSCCRCWTAAGSLRARLLPSVTTVGVAGSPADAGSAGEDSEVPSAPGRWMTNGSGPSKPPAGQEEVLLGAADSTLMLESWGLQRATTAGSRCCCSSGLMRTAICRNQGRTAVVVGWQLRASGVEAWACRRITAVQTCLFEDATCLKV